MPAKLRFPGDPVMGDPDDGWWIGYARATTERGNGLHCRVLDPLADFRGAPAGSRRVTSPRGVLAVLSTVVGTTVALITGVPAHGAQVVALDGVVVVEARSTACHALKAVALDGAQRLVVKGSVCMKKSAALHHLTHHDRYVIANLWTDVEIYDFADLRRPRLVRSFSLDETHPPWGGGGFVTEGDGVLLLLGTTVSAELRISGPPSQWRVRNLDVTPELRHRTESLYSEESRRSDPADMLGGDPRTVRLDKGRFEVRWDSTRPSRGVIRHRQYLRAAESGATLLIDTRTETID